jgi:hypothetical protein
MKDLFLLLALAFNLVLTFPSEAVEAKKTKAKNTLKVKDKKVEKKVAIAKKQRLTPVEESKNLPPLSPPKPTMPDNGKIEMTFANEIPVERPAE